MRLLFVCVGNSCRSQMAEGIAKSLGHDADSAGTHPANEVSPNAIRCLILEGLTQNHYTQKISIFSIPWIMI